MNKKLIEIISKKIAKNGYYGILGYERLYPDTLKKTTGAFRIEINNSRQSISFDIVAKEGRHSFSDQNLSFYEYFNNSKDPYNHLSDLLNKFKNLKELYKHLYSRFDFLKANDYRLIAFDELKADLEDDIQSFEDLNFF